MSAVVAKAEKAPARSLDKIFADMESSGISDGISVAPNWLPACGNIRRIGDLHDLLYMIGGTEADRERADQALHDGIIREAVKRGGGFWGWVLRRERRGRIVADLYYIGVQMWGRSYFTYRNFQVGLPGDLIERALAVACGDSEDAGAPRDVAESFDRA